VSTAFSLLADEPVALVERLGDRHRYFAAYQRLLSLGSAATAAAEDGLSHPDPRVRELCCMLLDHVAGSATCALLLEAMHDPAPEVRIQAIHALACERCKADSCRPDAAAVLPAALTVLAEDPCAKVRSYAVELVGVWVHTDSRCAAALTSAAHEDPSAAVRKKAAWYAPGGVIFERNLRKLGAKVGRN
jgi:hypothetical protein